VDSRKPFIFLSLIRQQYQIGDENVHLLRCLLDETFGSENFICKIVFQKTGSQSGDFVQSTNDYLCWYAKDRNLAKQKFNPLFSFRDEREAGDFSPDPLTSVGETQGSTFDFMVEGRKFHPGVGAHWKTNREGMERLLKANRIVAQKTQIRFKRYWHDFPAKPFSNVWSGLGGASDMTYVVQTNTKVIERCLLMTTDPGDLVLDPTMGSATTAYVAEQWGRRWITIDTSRVALALARTRLMSAKFDYYLLADSPEGRLKDQEITGISNVIPANFGANRSPIAAEGKTAQSRSLWESNAGVAVKAESDIKKGFVYKRVPHVTLKAIANNPEIDTIYAKWQEQLEPIRTELNRLLKQAWEEWQIPREAEASWQKRLSKFISSGGDCDRSDNGKLMGRSPAMLTARSSMISPMRTKNVSVLQVPLQ
jgi:adenine-specific DNA-methyltransferase